MLIFAYMTFSELMNFMRDMSEENKRHRINVELDKDIATSVRITNLSAAGLQAFNKERNFLGGMRLSNSDAVWFAVLEFLEIRRAMIEAEITIDDIRAMRKK